MEDRPVSDGPSDACPFCEASVLFDAVLDMNICIICGARETAEGWQAGVRQSNERKDG
jgi:hypothetical protein